MRFYTGQHGFHCGIDLHAHTMAVCILDAAGEIVFERNLPTTPEAFLETIAPYREGLVVACECLFTWYWLADLCAKEQIAFVLGHALFMKAIHGGKARNDRIDAHKIAVLLRSGMLPQAYVYPPGMRETRDFLRRRLHLVRKRGQLLAHLQNLTHAYNRGAFAKRISYPSNRVGVVAHFAGEPMLQANAALDLSLLDHYGKLLVELERRPVRQAKREATSGFHLLLSIPGIGRVRRRWWCVDVDHTRRQKKSHDGLTGPNREDRTVHVRFSWYRRCPRSSCFCARPWLPKLPARGGVGLARGLRVLRPSVA